MSAAIAAPAAARTTVRPGEPAWPRGVGALRDAPAQLRVLGDPAALPAPAIAIVGARAATSYGTAVARRIARDLAAAGWVVVSGLARGIDAAAHQGALDAGGSTVAVLPCGLDHVTPQAHAALAEAIAVRGALVSERPDAQPVTARGEFVRRNRLIAALGRATLVVEAAEGSGALTTATIAARLGRPVLAVPADVDRESSRGTLALLRAGARIAADAGDVLAAVGGEGGPRPPESAWLDDVPRTVDELAGRAGRDPAATSAALLELSWAGLATALPGGRWRRGRA